MRAVLAAAIAAFLALPFASGAYAASGDDALVTVAERSGFTRTGRYEEVQRLCSAFQQRWPRAVRCFEYGRTPEGRPMLALAVTQTGALDAARARREQRTVVLMQGGIHAGEIDGKDAGFLLLRELLEGRIAAGLLERLVFVFVPVFNADGHERFGRWNRPNQRGPEEMGWRTTAQNLNLNRDYMKADAPETQAMLRLLGQWDPILYADLHVTDGAQFQVDLSVNTEPFLVGDAELRTASRALTAQLVDKLTGAGWQAVDFYPSFVTYDDPASGFARAGYTPRFSQAYWALRNRIGILIETHSWKDYPARVRMTHASMLDMLQAAAADGAQWRRLAAQAEARDARLAGSELELTWDNTAHSVMIDFPGYAYTRTPSEVSGALVTRYDERKPETWHVPMRDEVAATLKVQAPGAGYVVPASQAQWLAEKLRLHGVEFRNLKTGTAPRQVEAFRASKVTLAATISEGRTRVALEGAWQVESRAIEAGALFVPIAQPRARLIAHLFEPLDPDSLVQWGYFNYAFQRTEYLEDYVAEDVAREMLRDPQVKREFEARLAADASFAKDPQARLEFFARRHSSWDERYNLYPVLRVSQPP